MYGHSPRQPGPVGTILLGQLCQCAVQKGWYIHTTAESTDVTVQTKLNDKRSRALLDCLLICTCLDGILNSNIALRRNLPFDDRWRRCTALTRRPMSSLYCIVL